ncbi:hypothetical protein [Candidatus Phytoplasma sp. AldY-WA1]|uniref:hypothetical protein n=1 Tax=Candidatus Phytoplasma sp. AldY-WA1 TaxID=2852100 RepID=UPI00254C36E7|nr:hypothetical protein [Candidatus Phytoplasma sp. AldY-WA1]
MISITMLFFKYYKQIILLISIIPIIFLIYGMYKFSLKKIIISIAIIIVLLCAFFYLTKREPSSKYAAKTVIHLDEKLKQYDNLLTNYDGLNTKLYDEAKKLEAEIKEDKEALNLTKEEKEKIEKKLEDNKNKIKEIRDKYDNVEQNICILNGQLIDLKKRQEDKEKEIKQKEEQLAKEEDEEVRKQLKKEIEDLQTKHMEIIKQIVEVERKIADLEADKDMYTEMLNRAKENKKELEQDYKDLSINEKKLFDQIKDTDKRLKQIEAQIEENKTEMKKIDDKLAEIEIERQMAEACKRAWDTHEQKNKFSFGLLCSTIMDGANLYVDTITGRALLKTAGNTTKQFSNFLSTTTLTLHETHNIINKIKQNYYNEDGTPQMMSKETYDSVCARTERDLEKYEGKYKECKAKGDKLLEDQNPDNLQQLMDNSQIQRENIKERRSLKLNAYANTIRTLIKELNKTTNLKIQEQLKKQLEEQQTQYNELIEANKNQLKQKSPNFNARNNHFNNMRYVRHGIKI